MTTSSTTIINSVCDFLQAKARELQTEKDFKAWLKSDAEMQRLHIPVKWAVAIAFDCESQQAEKDQAAKDKRDAAKAEKETAAAGESESASSDDGQEVKELRQKVKQLSAELDKKTMELDLIRGSYQFSPERFLHTDDEIIARQEHQFDDDFSYTCRFFKHAGFAPTDVMSKDELNAQLKSFFRRMAKQYHPDRAGGSHAAMLAVNAALKVMEFLIDADLFWQEWQKVA